MRTMTEAAERLAIVTLNLDLMCKRAAVARDPQAARLTQLAVDAVDLAADVMLGLALLVQRETHEAEGRLQAHEAKWGRAPL